MRMLAAAVAGHEGIGLGDALLEAAVAIHIDGGGDAVLLDGGENGREGGEDIIEGGEVGD